MIARSGSLTDRIGSNPLLSGTNYENSQMGTC